MNKIKGFTPASDYLCQEYDPLTALVYGKVWRYTDYGGKCNASQKRIAEELGVGVATVKRRLSTLENDGFIKRLDFQEGGTIPWIPTGKLNWETTVVETIDGIPSSEGTTPLAQRELPPSSERATKIVNKDKKIKEYSPELLEFLDLWGKQFPDKRQSRPATLSKKFETRYKSGDFRENWKAALLKASQTPHLLKSGWFQAEYFLRNDENYLKIIDGAFDTFGGNGNGEAPKSFDEQLREAGYR